MPSICSLIYVIKILTNVQLWILSIFNVSNGLPVDNFFGWGWQKPEKWDNLTEDF